MTETKRNDRYNNIKWWGNENEIHEGKKIIIYTL